MIPKISFTVLLVLQSSKTALKHPDGTGPIARIDASLRVTVGLGPQLAGSGQARISQPVWKFEAAGGGKNYRDAVDTTPPPRSAEAAQPSRFTRCRPYAPNRPGPRPCPMAPAAAAAPYRRQQHTRPTLQHRFSGPHGPASRQPPAAGDVCERHRRYSARPARFAGAVQAAAPTPAAANKAATLLEIPPLARPEIVWSHR